MSNPALKNWYAKRIATADADTLMRRKAAALDRLEAHKSDIEWYGKADAPFWSTADEPAEYDGNALVTKTASTLLDLAEALPEPNDH